MKEISPFKQGYHAFGDGEDREDNPYDESHKDERDEWESGWSGRTQRPRYG